MVKADEKYPGITEAEIDEAARLLDPEGAQARATQNISKKGNWREVKKVIDASDVII